MYLMKAIGIGGKDYHHQPQLSKEARYNLEQISNFVEVLESAIFYLENKEVKADGTTTDGIPSKTKVLGILPNEL
jgi:hypothetical protein